MSILIFSCKDSSFAEIVEHSLHQAALWDEVKNDIHTKSGLELSGGQQQRLCIARTIPVEEPNGDSEIRWDELVEPRF